MSSEITLTDQNLGYIFPVLFVTIACGAISGFHSLVASGTTSKQLDKVSDAKVVGFWGNAHRILFGHTICRCGCSF